MLTPTDAVLSVNGKTGAVTLNLDNINDGSVRKLANYVPKSLTSAKGDMIYASAANTPARLGIGSNGQFLSVADGIPKWVNIPLAGFEDILKGIKGRTQVEWNALNAGEYGSNSTYNGATLPPVLLENNSGFWNSASGKPLDISFHFAKKERITTLQVKCPPYSGVNPTMTVYYAQKGDAGLTLYKEITTISTADRKAYEFNEEGISADYWVVRFTSSGWIDLRLCSPSGLFTTGLYTEECHQQIMDRFNGYQPVGNYALKNEIIAKSLTSAKGDMIYASAASTPARLGIGSNGQFLSVANGIPAWVNNPNTHNSHIVYSGKKSDGTTDISSGTASSGNITLGDSGVTAGAYGDTTAQTPGYGKTFKVPSISVNAKGIVTAVGEHTVKIPASDNTDTKNTAGSMDSAEKLYLVGAKSQAANPQTYSNSKVYMTNGTLTAPALSTSVIESQSANLNIKVSNNGIKNAASFGYDSLGGALLSFDGHLKINDGGSYSGKPTNQTA